MRLSEIVRTNQMTKPQPKRSRIMITPLKKLLTWCLLGLALAAQVRAATVQISTASIVGNVNWYRTNEYVLNGFVFVASSRQSR